MRAYAAFFIVSFLTLQPFDINSQPQAVLFGTVTSLDGSSLPTAHVTLDPYLDNLFFNSVVTEVDSNNSFSLTIPQSGLYRLTVSGVMHKQFSVPIWIRDPDTHRLHVELDPKNLDDGEYFDSNEYLSWIRVTGNFNGYNYDRGIRFDRIDSTTLRAEINTSLDTLTYQITGLTSGTTVLPGAADYRLRNSDNYVAVLPVHNNRAVLTYKADSTYFDNKNPFKGYRTTWDLNQSQIIFEDETEGRIHQNLRKENLSSRIFNFAMFDSDSMPRDKFEYTMEQHYRESWEMHLEKISAMEDLLGTSTFENEYLSQAMFYQYLLVSDEIIEAHKSGLLEGMVNDLDRIVTEPGNYIDTGILDTSMDVIPPESPLWSLRKDLIFTLPEMLGISGKTKEYLEEVVRKNRDTDITGRVLYQLFTHSFDRSGRSDQTQNYYRLMLDMFGNDYYARKAREYVQNND